MRNLIFILFISLSLNTLGQQTAADSTASKKQDTVVKKPTPKKEVKKLETPKNTSEKKKENNVSTPKKKSTTTKPKKTNVSKKEEEDDPTIKGQFEKIYRISTTYQTYKVISIDRFKTLKNNVLDSLEKSNLEIRERELELKSEKESIVSLNEKLEKANADLKVALTKENSISLFGTNLNKITYNLLLWSIILILGSLLSFFIFRFSRSNVLTKKAQESLREVEEEFEIHRKKSLEREQKLRRELQDEINKQRGV